MARLLGVASEWHDPVRIEVRDTPDRAAGTPYTVVLRTKWWHPLIWWIAVKSFARVAARSIRAGQWG